MFGPSHNSTSPESGLELDWPTSGPPVKWRGPIGTGYSSPVVVGDKLVIFYREDDESVLACRNARTGKRIWDIRRPTSFHCRYDYSNGPYSTPVINGDFVFAVDAEGRFVCAELTTGRVVWERFLTREYHVKKARFAVASSPLIVGNRLIFNLGGREKDAGIIALDKSSGATIWTATKDGPGYATPRLATIHGKSLVFVLTEDGLVCLTPTNGDVLWNLPFKANHPEYINATSPCVIDDRVFLSVYKKGSMCVQILPDGHKRVLWKTRRGFQSQFSTLMSLDEHVYGFDAVTRKFRCINLKGGKSQWGWPTSGIEGVGRGQAIAVGDRFILFGEYGKLASLGISASRPVPHSMSKPLLSHPCYSSPALANGLLFLRNEREIVCFDLSRPANRVTVKSDSQ